MSKAFTRAQRTEAAFTHYAFEQTRYTKDYREAVYRNGGLLLWAKQESGVEYAIKLLASTKHRHEGAVSVVLFSDQVLLCEMSFAWVEGSNLGLKRGLLPFITRNQSISPGAAELATFRASFPNNSPRYLCLAALQAIATVHGVERIAAVKHDRQISYTRQQSISFENSYTNLWRELGATEVGKHAFSLPVPFALPPIDLIEAKHRGRARRRRAVWEQIFRETVRSLAIRRRAVIWYSSTDSPRSSFSASSNSVPIGPS